MSCTWLKNLWEWLQNHLFEWLAEIRCHWKDSGRVGTVGNFPIRMRPGHRLSENPATCFCFRRLGSPNTLSSFLYICSVFAPTPIFLMRRRKLKTKKSPNLLLFCNKWYVLLNLEVERSTNFDMSLKRGPSKIWNGATAFLANMR